jgi:hypothetical protein
MRSFFWRIWYKLFPDILLKRFMCHECGYKDRDGGIGGWGVRCELWKAFGNGKGMMCIDCFETKMGRKITAKDLSSTLDNRSHHRIQALLRREGYSPKAGWGSRGHFVWEEYWID